MQNNNLIDLKKFQPAKKDKKDEEAEHLANLEILRREKEEKTLREVQEARESVLLAEENEPVVEQKKDVNTFWPLLGKFFLYLLIFLLPLFFLPTTIYPIDANKQFLAVFLVLASLLCYLANFYFSRKIIYSKSVLIYAAVFFVIAGGISAFFSISSNNSLYGDFTQADVFNNFIIYGLALYLAAVFFKKQDFNKIGITFLASTALVSLLGLAQLFGFYIFPFDFAKQIGFNVFGSVINFDIFLTFGLVLIVAALTELNISLKIKACLVFTGLLIALNLILINYKQVWILLAVMMLLYAVYKFTFKSERDTAFWASSSTPFLIGVVAFLFALISPSLPKVVNLPGIPVDIKPNFSSTMNILKGSAEGFHILTGTGLATFSSQYNIYRPVELNQSNFWRIKFNQGFSFAGTYLVTAGVIGFLSILFMIFAFARLATKNIEDKKSMVLSIGMFFMILCWFFFPASFTGLVFSFTALGLLAALNSSAQEIDFLRVPRSRAAISFVLLIAFTAGAISMLYFFGKKYVAALYFQNGLKEYSLNNTVKSAEEILKAISLDQNNDQYLRSASQILLIDAGNSRDQNIDINKDINFQSKIADSIALALRAAEVNPANSENWYNLGDVYEKIISIADGAADAAEKNYRKAAELNPKNPDPLIGQARVLMFAARQAEDDKARQEKISGAIDVLKKAVSLKSDYAASHFQLGVAYTQDSRGDEAIKEFEFTKLLSDFDAPINFQLGILYYNDDDFDKAKIEMENAISQDPNFSNARYVLGLIYDKKGDKNNAINQFENVLRLNPNSSEVKEILNNLRTKGSAFFGDNSAPSEIINQSLEFPASDQKESFGAPVDNLTGENFLPPLEQPAPSVQPLE